MDPHKKIREEMVAYAKSMGVTIIIKEDSWFMKALSWLAYLFNPAFMTYITVVGKKIYFPKDVLKNDYAVWQVLVHELIHVYDMRSWRSFVYGVGYFTPQIFAFLALLTIFHSWWWLLCLGFLAPIPSYVRFWVEARGYAGSIAAQYWSNFRYTEIPEYMIKNFVGKFYYFMWPFRSHVVSTLKMWLEKIVSGEFEKEIPIAKDMKNIVEKHMK